MNKVSAILGVLLLVFYTLYITVNVHADFKPNPRFERILEEETGNDNFVHYFEVWHDKDSGQEVTCAFGQNGGLTATRPGTCWPTGRNWK